MKEVSKQEFIINLGFNQFLYPNIKAATSPVKEVIEDKTDRTFYLDSTGSMGYAIDETGELTSLYSTVKGYGKTLVQSAISNGASHLDCFDGFLTTFYKGLGFEEVDRVANWTTGQPDIVFMRLEK